MKKTLEIIPIDQLFLPDNIQKSVDKAIDILDKIKGDTIDEKLSNIGDKFKGLEINGIQDKDNYKIVHSALLDIQKVRVAIKKVGKSWRDNLTSQNRLEMEREKYLLELFTGVEEELRNKKNNIDLLKEKEERKKLLPMRRKLLKDIKKKIEEDIILSMDEKEFAEYYANLKDEYDEEQEIIRKEKEANKQRLLDIEKAKKEAREQAEKQAEREKKELLLKAEREKQDIIDEQKRRDNERIEEENRLKAKELDRQRAEKEAKERAEKNKQYNGWKKKNNFNQETDKIERNGNEFILYRRISELIIN